MKRNKIFLTPEQYQAELNKNYLRSGLIKSQNYYEDGEAEQEPVEDQKGVEIKLYDDIGRIGNRLSSRQYEDLNDSTFRRQTIQETKELLDTIQNQLRTGQMTQQSYENVLAFFAKTVKISLFGDKIRQQQQTANPRIRAAIAEFEEPAKLVAMLMAKKLTSDTTQAVVALQQNLEDKGLILHPGQLQPNAPFFLQPGQTQQGPQINPQRQQGPQINPQGQQGPQINSQGQQGQQNYQQRKQGPQINPKGQQINPQRPQAPQGPQPHRLRGRQRMGHREG